MEWQKQIPNKPGYWMRVNAGHRIQLHHIFDDTGRGLELYWGWGGDSRLIRISEIKDKLKYFYWYGPLPEPPKEAL